MAKAELRHRLADVLRLIGIERAGQPGLHVAERAGARARVAHDHEGRVLLLPALADVRAAGLLAHRVQAVLLHDALRLRIAARDRRLDADPVRLAQYGRIRPMRLLGMARARRRGQIVDDDGHRKPSLAPYLRSAAMRRKCTRCSAGNQPGNHRSAPARAPPAMVDDGVLAEDQRHGRYRNHSEEAGDQRGPSASGDMRRRCIWMFRCAAIGRAGNGKVQTVATGVTGEPTAPGSRSGGAVSRKRLRLCARSQSASSLRYQISPR